MIGYNKSRLVYYCPIKRARTSFGSRGPQELFPLPFHTHNLNHISAFFYPCLSCLGLACLTLVSLLLHTGCWLSNIRDSVFSHFIFVLCTNRFFDKVFYFSPPWVVSPTFHFCLSLTTLFTFLTFFSQLASLPVCSLCGLCCHCAVPGELDSPVLWT